MSIALVIFAKTIQLSPVKTRLGAQIGQPLAQTFYQLSVKATTELAVRFVALDQIQCTTYWALAEKQALKLPQWQNFTAIWTGEGDLGLRLHNIYSLIRQKHETVIIIGTDSPQLESTLLLNAIDLLKKEPDKAIIGPAIDGGFYLFAAQKSIPMKVWTEVTYSQNNTLENLSANLERNAIPTLLLNKQTDVDSKEDLVRLSRIFSQANDLLPAQKKLYQWIKQKRLD